MPNKSKIAPETLYEYQKGLVDQLAERPSSLKRKLSSLRQFAQWAEKEGHLAPEEKRSPQLPIRKIIIGLGGVGLVALILFLVARLPQIPKIIPSPLPTQTVIAGYSPWIIPFQGKLLSSGGQPINQSANVIFKLYKEEKDGSPLWTSKTWELEANSEGKFTASIGDAASGDNELPSNYFFQEKELFLGIEVNGQAIPQIMRVGTAANAANAYLLQEYPPNLKAEPLMIPVINEDGALVLAAQNPAIKAISGTMGISADSLTLFTPDASDGSITLNPDGKGVVNLLFEGKAPIGGDGFLNAKNANQTSGALIYGEVANNATGYRLIELVSGSTPTTRFSVDAQGNTFVAGQLKAQGAQLTQDLNLVSGNLKTGGVTRLTNAGRLSSIGGYYQDSGEFRIDQGAPDLAKITKSGVTASADGLAITMDETPPVGGASLTASNYDTLVLKRLGGGPTAYALYLAAGNALFEGTLEVKKGLTASENLDVKDSTTLGDATSDTITATARFASSLIPSTNASYDLGSATYRWNNLYLATANFTGDLTVGGDLAVNGGDLTTTATTFNLLNTTATTLNIGGAATTLSIGASTGTTTVNNALTVTGALTANGQFTLGDGGDTGAINTSDWDISTAGAMTNIDSVSNTGANLTISTTTSGNIVLDSAGGTLDIDDATISLATQATDIDIIDNTASSLTISEGSNNYLLITTTNGAEVVTLDLPAGIGGTGNLFTSNNTKTINLGTGTAADTINIGTGGTTADDINLGGLATSTIDILGVTKLGDGGSTNYAQFSSTGDLTFVGTADTITGPGAGGLTITNASGNIALSTTTSGDITATTGAGTGLVNVLTGNLKVGNGTPSLTQDGEDTYIEGTLEVDGLARFDGSVDLGDAAADTITFTGVVDSNIIADANNTRNLGSSAVRWATGYFVNVDATNLIGTIVGGSTTASTWTINSDNATNNAEIAAVAFETGTATFNSVMQWNAAGDAGRQTGYDNNFLFNYPISLFSQVSGAEQTFTSGSLINYGQSATHAITQSGAFVGADIDFSSNITVPNSSSGNQTGVLITLKDGGASATSIGFQTAGTLDYGLDIGGTVGTAEIRLSNAETISNTTNGTIAFGIDGTNELSLITTALFPSTDSGLDLGSATNQFADLYLDGGNINLDNATDIDIDDAVASVFTISQGTNNFIAISTDTDSLSFGNATTNPTYSFLGTGAVTITGSAEGTNALVLTTGDARITDGDLILSGGEILATADDTTGTSFSFTGVNTTGDTMGIVANSLTTGTALAISSTATSFNGELLTLSKTGASGSTALTSDIANLTYSQTFDGGVGLTSSGNVLDVSRSITLNNLGNTHTLSGALVSISDTGTQTQGTLTHTANVLSLTQNYSSSTGDVLNISNAGTGDAIEIGGAGTRSINSTSGNLTLKTTTSGNIVLDSTGGVVDIDDATISLATQATDLDIIDNSSTALTISEGTNNYLFLNTANDVTVVTLDTPVAGTTSTTGNLFTAAVNKTVNLSDSVSTNTVDIGGVTNSGTDTINIATNSTAADIIAIGNSNASTTLALTGGDDWSISTAGTGTFANLVLTTGNLSDSDGAVTINDDLTINGTAVTLAGNSTVLDMTGTGTLGLNTTTNRAITTGTGLFTTGGALTVTTDLTVNGNTTLGNSNTVDTLTGNLLTSTISSGATTQTAVGVTASSLTTGEILDLTATFAPTAGGTQSAIDINLTNNPVTSANTLRGLDIGLTDAGTLANTVYGLYVDATTANANDTTYAAVFQGGNVGIGTTNPSALLSVGSTSQFQVSTLGAVTAVGVNSGSGLIQGTGGLTLTGATSINASGTNATNIGTGTNAGTITIGNTSTGDLALNDAQWNITGAGAANFASLGVTTPGSGAFTTLTSSGATTLGTGSSLTNTFGSGASSINTIGAVTTPGALTLHGATTLDNTFTVSGSNLTSLGGNLTVTGTAWTATPTISGAVTMTSGFDSNAASTVAGLTVDGNGNLTVSNGTFSVAAPSTTGTAVGVTASSLTTGEILDLTGTFAPTAGGTQSAIDINLTNSPVTSANTLRGLDIGFTDSGTLANTVYGLYVDATTANANDTTYAAVFQGGNVGIGTTGPNDKLDVAGNIRVSGTGNSILFMSSSGAITAGQSGITADNPNGGNVLINVGSASNGITLQMGGADEYRFTSTALTMYNNIISDIGNAGTDFDTLGGLTLAADLAVNGGDITTTATTFNLVNATATTVNFAGAGTTVSIGATTGTLTLNNATISAPNATTFNCVDCINFDDLADSLSLDATTTIAAGASNLAVNLDSTGDFVIQDAGVALLTVNDTGFSTYAAPAPTEGANVFAFSNTAGVGTSYDILDIALTAPSADTLADTARAAALTIPTPAESVDTIVGLAVVGATATAGTEVALDIPAITAGAGTETAIRIGSGWDTGIDAGTTIITNIGDASTDFVAGGGLNLADPLIFSAAGTLGTSDAGMAADNPGGGNLSLNTGTGNGINLQVAAATEYRFDSAGLTMYNNIISDIGNAGTDFVASTGGLNLAGDLTLAANANLTMSSGTGIFTQTHAPTTDATADAHSITLSAGGTGSTGVLRGLVVNQADTATTGVYDTLAYLGNQKTPETTTNGLFIEQNAASGTLSNAIQITNTAGTLATGINFTGTFTNYLVAPNFSVSNAGAVVAVGVNSGSGLIQGTGGLTVTGTTNINATGTSATNIGNSTGALTLASGGTSAWTNTSGNLTLSTATSGTLALTSAGALNLSAGAASTWTLPAVANALNIDANTLTIDALNDRVGIGTTGPQTKLHLLVPDDGGIRIQAGEAGWGAARIEFYSDPIGDVNEWRPGYITSADSGSFTGRLDFYTNIAGQKINSVLGMSVVNGNVGIGTTGPGALLDIDRPDTSSNSELITTRSSATTQTITGAVANARFNQFLTNTITAATAQTVTNAATLYIEGATTAAGVGPASITNNYALWVDAGLVRFDRDSIGSTATDSLFLMNTTDAALGAQQYSPALRFRGEGWKTDVTAASQNIDWRVYAVPVQGAANPTSYLSFDSSINDAAFSNVMALSSGGNVGIGTTAPGTKLSVRVDGDGANAVLRLSSILANWTAGYGPRLLFHGGTDDRVFGEIGSFLQTTGNGGYAYMTFSTRDAETLGERMRITSGGNVGIGTTSPVAADSSARTLQIGSRYIFQNVVGSQTLLSNNAYYDGAWKYATTDTAIGIRMNASAGAITFHLAASGTAGNTITNWDGSDSKMIIDNDGDVGIGGNPGTAKLYVNGNVGIGTTSPLKKLDVRSIIGAGSSALNSFVIMYSDLDNDNPSIAWGDSDNARALEFGTFSDYSTMAGWSPKMIITNAGSVGIGTTAPDSRVQISGGGLCVGSDANCNTDNNTEGYVYAAQTAMIVYDVAENYPTKDETLGAGEVVSLDKDNAVFVQRSSSAYNSNLLGVISTEPAVLLGGFKTEKTQFPDEIQVPIALSGRVPVKVSTENGAIEIGDPLTSSSTPGVAMRATKAGPIVGKALEAWDDTKILGYYDTEKKEYIPKENLAPNISISQYPNLLPVAKLLTFVNVSWYDPDVYLTGTGELKILRYEDTKILGAENEATNSALLISQYPSILVSSTGEIIRRIGAFAELAVANLKAGFIQTQDLIAEKKIVSPVVETDEIEIRNQELGIRNKDGEMVMKIDNEGKTTHFGDLLVNGQIQSNNITTNNITIENDATISGTLYADEIVTRKGTFGELMAASVSAETIAHANLTEIQSRLADLENTLQPTTTPTPTPDPSQPVATASALSADTQNWQLTDPSGDLRITSDVRITGKTNLAQTIVAGPLSQDGSLIIDQGNSINVTTGTLYLQNLGFGGVDILAGKVVIDMEGNVQVAGNLAVGGNLSAATLHLGGVTSNTSEVTGTGSSDGGTESGFGKLLEIKGPTDEIVASVDASGNAQFAQVNTKQLMIASDYSATQSGVLAQIQTNATSGIGIFPAGQTEFTVFNQKINDNTLIYITPVSNTQNKVLYVSAKKAGEFFKVAIDTPINQDIQFNWWIIN